MHRLLPWGHCLVALFAWMSCIDSEGLRANASDAPYQILPARIELVGAEDSAGVLVQKKNQDVLGAGVNEQFTFRIVDESVAAFSDGRIVAKKNGQTELVAEKNEGANQVVHLKVPVIVSGCDSESPLEFDAHVQSILTRAGCNSGACHGALAGKGGFRLSLRGYDSQTDHFNITRQDRGRRVEPAEPGRSLFLAKPTGMVEHKGGVRLDPNSSDYRTLANWISRGANGPRESDPKLLDIEVLPKDVQLTKASQQRLLVLARYSNGRVDDVTHWAKFSATNEAVASVDESGRVSVIGSGKGAVVAWFASRVSIASIVVPYDNPVSESLYADFQPANFIDEILLDEWKHLHLVPSPGCSDEVFLRRAYLDTVGKLPTREQIQAFLGDTRRDRRERLIEDLLASEAFVDYWSYKWSDLLLINGNLLRPDAVASFYKWVRSNVQENVAWDQFVRQIVLARGESMQDGATNFYAIHQDPESLTENTCQAFLGLSIGCAKCHNHPLEKWTNDQYYSMANLYARVRAKGWGGDARNGDGKRTLIVLDRGDLIQPSKGKPQPPAPLDSEPIDMSSPRDRREALAEWLTDSKNPYFARAIANRVWANFMGVGLVESVDDMRVSNPASSERLLQALADRLVESKFDLKDLMRAILNSRTYARSSEPLPSNSDDRRMYCRYTPRRLMAEVLHDAICQVTGVPTKFTEIEFPGADKNKTDIYSEGTTSLQLHDSAVANYFLRTFGRHQRRITCDCERSDQPTVVQVLHLHNGDTLNLKLSDKKSVVTKWIEESLPMEEVVDQAYLLALSRYPSADERKRLMLIANEESATGIDRRQIMEDLLWGLMTSPEFLFAH